MAIIRQELASYGAAISDKGLSAGAGGNISAREGRLIWVKPSGFSMGEIQGKDLCCIDIDSGRQIEGPHRPTSELPMHLAVYKNRPDVNAVFHTHSPYATGLISSGRELLPLSGEAVADLGGIKSIPYILPGGKELAEAVNRAAETNNTILMKNHGVVCLGKSMRQAFFRICVTEEAAKIQVAASLGGVPEFLSQKQIAEIESLTEGSYRSKILGN